MRHQGKIATWKDDKGFGFIAPNGGDAQIFVHISSFSNQQRRPTGNEIVTYELKRDEKGRAQAFAVVFVGERTRPFKPSGYSSIPLLLSCIFLVFVAVAAFTDKIPKAILALYLVASVITFVVYALDKSAARNNRWRTQESTLHLFALLGGWPGALAAQRLLRHKSKKKSFQVVFLGTAILNCGVLGWLFTPSGAATLLSIFRVVQGLVARYF